MKTMKYINLQDRGLVLAVPPKCGSSSVYTSLQTHFNVPNLAHARGVRLLKSKLVWPDAHVVFVLRDPIDRFKSLWRNKCRDGGKVMGADRALVGLTPSELLEFIKAYGNHHWTPLTEMLDALPVGIDVEFVRLNDLDDWWRAHMSEYPPLLRRNVTAQNHMPVLGPSIEMAVRKHYAKDVALWESLC